jgi:hypothetical protein
MRFSLDIPAPANLDRKAPLWWDLRAGETLHRIHPDAFKAAQFNDTRDGAARFSPIDDASGRVVPTIYGAQSFEVAVTETILRCPDTPPDPKSSQPTIIYPRDHAHRAYSAVTTRHDMKLIDLTTAGQRALGVDRGALLAGPKSTYPMTQSWAAALHHGFPEAQGLYYSSHQYGPAWAVVLFGDRLPPDPLQEIRSEAVSDPDCHKRIKALAKTLGMSYANV